MLAVFEPERLLPAPGWLVGARYAGDASEGAAVEPLLGYRRFVDRGGRFSAGLLAYGTYASGEQPGGGASFSAARGGLELLTNFRFTPSSKWIELHASASGSLTGVDAAGRYCVADDGRFGIDCPDEPPARKLLSAEARGIYPAAHLGLALDFGRGRRGPFHGLSLGVALGGGTMPSLVSGVQRGARAFGTAGLSLTLGLGATSLSEP